MSTPTQMMITGLDPVPQLPIVFKINGLDTDTQLQVFGQVFHVHSSALKLHSEYFRKFLDSADKPKTHIGKYRYSWVTKVDDDGLAWSLVSGHTMQSHDEGDESTEFGGDKRAAEHVFHAFLCAIYTRPYQVDNAVELDTLAIHGDFYQAMPIVSATVSAAVRRSSKFARTLPGSAGRIIVTAAKMKNELLFRECLVHLVNPWTGPRYTSLQDPALFHAAELAYNQLGTRVAKAQEELLLLANSRRVDSLDGALWENAVGGLIFRGASNFVRSGRIMLPGFFRSIYATITANGHHQANDIESILKPLFKNNLVLTGAHAIAGEGTYQDHFFCVEIDDVDLPWDTTA